MQLLGGEGGGASGQGQSPKGKVVWPEMGMLEWLICKQVMDEGRGRGREKGNPVSYSNMLDFVHCIY